MGITIAAIATPSGRGGVGIIRISGPGALELALALTGRAEPFTARYAYFLPFLAADDHAIDRGLLLYFQGPFSYTGEDVIELQAHGGPVLMQALLSRVLELGASMAEAGEFTRRAVANGKMGLEQAEAVAASIDASTMRAARQAQRHLQGEFGEQVGRMMEELTSLLAHIEACLDFPEEEIPPMLYEQLRSRLDDGLLLTMNRALKTADFGERLLQGVTVTIVGAPNVGKSSLFNHLSGRNRAIVSDVPGTTRDILELDFEVHGIPVRLLDTAGLRESQDRVEQEGVSRAREAAHNADLTLGMADATDERTWDIQEEVDIHVLNKCDLLESMVAIPGKFVPISVHDGSGMDQLINGMAVFLGDIPEGEEGVLVSRQRHRQLIERARAHLLAGRDLLGEASMLDVAALEWRQAWTCLGEVLGMGDVEHILDKIFSEFCIGK